MPDDHGPAGRSGAYCRTGLQRNRLGHGRRAKDIAHYRRACRRLAYAGHARDFVEDGNQFRGLVEIAASHIAKRFQYAVFACSVDDGSLTYNEFLALIALYETRATLGASDLADYLLLQRKTTWNILLTLEDLGLVSKTVEEKRDDPLSSVIDVLFDVNQIGSLKLLQHKGCVASWNA